MTRAADPRGPRRTLGAADRREVPRRRGTAARASDGVAPACRVVVGDVDPLRRAEIARLIEGESGLELCGEDAAPSAVLELVERRRPDALVLLDDMPMLEHARTFAEVRSTHPALPALLLVGVGRRERSLDRSLVLEEIARMISPGGSSPPSAARLLPAVLSSPRVARRFVAAATKRWDGGDVEVAARAELIASELVSNAVIHAHSPARVGVTGRVGLVRIEVTDWGLGELAPRRSGARDVDGRGLVLIDALADRWGVSARLGERTVWCELVMRPADRAGDPPTIGAAGGNGSTRIDVAAHGVGG